MATVTVFQAAIPTCGAAIFIAFQKAPPVITRLDIAPMRTPGGMESRVMVFAPVLPIVPVATV
ncbi:MAG: hypothetical protein H7X92_08660 [Chitinophagales bacterium]|nr:hypothetical protein [Hyphomicrobiales bacterium]